MAILPRRCIQKLIDASTRFSTPKKIAEQVGRLNKGDHSALAAEWELIVTSGLANVTPMEHEIRGEGSRNLDFRFTLPSGTQIVGDIVAVSDEVYDDDNPKGPLFDELLKRLKVRGISGSVSIGIDDAPNASKSLRPRQRLALPKQPELATRVFNPTFDGFLARVAAAPDSIHRHRVTSPEASLEIIYSPGRASCSIRHAPYALPRDPIRNPIYKALRGKREQLSDVLGNVSSPLRGVVLCDAGCESFRNMSVGPGYFTVNQIVHTFLTRTSSVKFVCIVRSIPAVGAFSNDVPRKFTFDAEVIGTLDPATRSEIEGIFSAAFSSLPKPMRTGLRARHFLRYGSRTRNKFSDSYDTGSMIRQNSVAVSVRALLDYATGRLKRPEFERFVNPTAIHQLRRFLDAGLAVHSIEIQNSGLEEQPGEFRDGDFAVIAFGDADPAACPFRAPPHDYTSMLS